VSFLLVIVGLAILVAVVVLAAGRGGEMSVERNDYAPLELGPVSATDVALLRPPAAAWGYNMNATDEALARIAESIRERDVRIVALEQLVTDLSRDPAPPPLSSPYVGSRRRRELPEVAAPLGGVRAGEAAWPTGQRDEQPQPAETAGAPDPAEVTWTAQTAWSREAARPSEAWPSTDTRPDHAILAEEGTRPEAGQPGKAGQPDGEGQAGPPEQSHD